MELVISNVSKQQFPELAHSDTNALLLGPNANPSFNMQAISNGLHISGHRVKGPFVKQRPQPFPQQPVTARFGPGRLEELTS